MWIPCLSACVFTSVFLVCIYLWMCEGLRLVYHLRFPGTKKTQFSCCQFLYVIIAFHSVWSVLGGWKMNAICVNRVLYTLHLVTLLEFYLCLIKNMILLHYRILNYAKTGAYIVGLVTQLKHFKCNHSTSLFVWSWWMHFNFLVSNYRWKTRFS